MVLSLPRSIATRSTSPVMSSDPVRRVLIIDDEPNIRAIVSTCLSRLGGWQVNVAASGFEALRLIEQDCPDAIILDIMMPAMDGISFLQHLRSHPHLAHIPVILLTGNADFTHTLAPAQWQVAGTIAKPFNPAILSIQIAEMLDW